MSVMSSPECSTAIRLVSRWGAWYTRDLPADVAGERRDELASDLWEHASWAHAQGQASTRVARSIVWRAAAGAASDLGWRWRQINGLPPREAHEHRLNATALSGVLLLVLAALAWAVFVFTRIARGVAEGTHSLMSEPSLGMFLFTLLAVIGIVLLLLRRTRFLGSLWLIVPLGGLIVAGWESLRHGSATASLLLYNMPGVSQSIFGAVLGISLLILAGSIRWIPTGTKKAVTS